MDSADHRPVEMVDDRDWLYMRARLSDANDGRYAGWSRCSTWFRTPGGIVWAWFRREASDDVE